MDDIEEEDILRFDLKTYPAKTAGGKLYIGLPGAA
jgi:hypothetical protein